MLLSSFSTGASMSDIDESSFPKARSLLLAYSGVVLALWFFGAKLEQFQLMGTAIQLNERVDQAWLILALLNLYLLVRYCQRLPPMALRFDARMHQLYSASLSWGVIRLKHFAMKRALDQRFANEPVHARGLKVVRGKAYLTCYDKIKADNAKNAGAGDIRFVTRPYRTEMKLVVEYAVDGKSDPSGYNRTLQLGIYEPPACVTWPIKAFVIIRGAFVTPWFTDFVAPLLFGVSSTLASVYMYLRLNHYLWL